jgi:general secretion pathway protein N
MSMGRLSLRPFTLALLTLAAMLVACLAWLASGGGQSLTWLAEPETGRETGRDAGHSAAHSAGPAAPRPPSLTEGQLQVAWQRPLFSPDRAPDAAAPGPAATRLEGLTLGGVVLDGTGADASRWALLHRQDQRALKLRLGETLDNGWTLSQLTPRVATFTRQGQSQTLSLPVLRLPPPSPSPSPTLPSLSAP